MEQILNKAEEVIQFSTKKPKLTMKVLYTLIEEIQLKNDLLVQRVNVLEQQFIEFNQSQAEIAAANEELFQQEIQAKEALAQEVLERGIQVSRAERHSPTRKKPFWYIG